MWTGFYAGLNAGSLWNTGNVSNSINWASLTAPGNFRYPTAFLSAPQTGFAWTSSPGFIGGGQVGYNWQLSEKVVVGVETDFQGIAGAGNNWNPAGLSGFPSSRSPSSIGSIRGRTGYLVAPNLRIYGTGGFSYGTGN
jgi:outer membrane immunogenic protein